MVTAYLKKNVLFSAYRLLLFSANFVMLDYLKFVFFLHMYHAHFILPDLILLFLILSLCFLSVLSYVFSSKLLLLCVLALLLFSSGDWFKFYINLFSSIWLKCYKVRNNCHPSYFVFILLVIILILTSNKITHFSNDCVLESLSAVFIQSATLSFCFIGV